MLTLYHHPFSAACRFARLALSEYDTGFAVYLERPWEKRPGFLIMNPAGTLPTAVDNTKTVLCGAWVLMEYLDETRGYLLGRKRLFPDSPAARAETRRLVAWFLDKMEAEVTGPFVYERIYKKEMPVSLGGGAPDSAILRQARLQIGLHMDMLEHLTHTRNWLSGAQLSFADFAAAATLSCADYLGEISWDRYENTKIWYARMKSRPSFRSLLQERIPGMPPAPSYADLDF